ncbi:MAG TPA: hypothetical protein ENN58_01980, partial [bacterium]|nr:hypothetical protein [bacterium]
MKIVMQYLTIFLMFLLFLSCSTTPSRKDVPEKREDEKPVDAGEDISVEGDTTEEDKDEDEDEDEDDKEISDEAKKKADKDKKDKKERSYFDGNRYKGPALKEFMDGLGHYFSDGCEKAVETWKKAYSKDKNRPEIAFNVGLCYERAGDFEKSKEWYIRSFKVNRNHFKSLYNYALLIGDKLNAEKDFLIKLVEKAPDKVLKNNFLSWLHIQINNLDLAEKHAKLSLKQDEQNVEAVVSLATVYYKKEMYELADMALNTASQWNPDNFRLQRLYGFN